MIKSDHTKKLDLFLKVLILIFPIFIVSGPFALNFFSIVFSIYAIWNYDKFKKFIFFNTKLYFFFFSFIILIFPYESIDFKNSFLKYLSFFRFVLMMFGLIIFLILNNKDKNYLFLIKKTYIVFLIIISIDVFIEFYTGTNIFGFFSNYKGRIASFTNDELIIGYVYCFLVFFTLFYIYKKSNIYFFFTVLIFIILTSFIIGERSNFIKLLSLIMGFLFVYFIFIKKIKFTKIKFTKIILLISILVGLMFTIYQFSKDTRQAYNLFFIDNLIIIKNDKLTFNFKGRFYQSNHAAHYVAAYEIFLNYPLTGVGINNFHSESKKSKYENNLIEKTNQRASTHPHQLYLEIISETGLMGLIYFSFVFFYPIYLSVLTIKRGKNIYLISNLYLHNYFIYPILPSGSFFGTNMGVPFWFNLAFLLYNTNKNSKI